LETTRREFCELANENSLAAVQCKLRIDAQFEIMPFKPLELLAVSKDLDGSVGTNRALPQLANIDATQDSAAILRWLDNYTDTPSTFNSYRKEAERLLLWTLTELGQPLSSLTSEDLEVYGAFLQDPQPADRWVSLTRGKYPRSDARWRPFNGPLSQTSQRQSIVILNAMFRWLVSVGYLSVNPMNRTRQLICPAPRAVRYLSTTMWEAVKCCVQLLPQDTPVQKAYYLRCRWLMTLFYLQGMRISEVAEGQMKHFFVRLGDDGQQQWWLETSWKGKRRRVVPASLELIDELRCYRKGNGLSPLPKRFEELPLVLPFRGTTRCLSRSAVHDAIKSVFATTASWLRSQGRDSVDLADQLDRASAHWLRHTAGFDMVDSGIDLGSVRDNLGHSSVSSTYSLYLYPKNPYVHPSLHDRHTDTVTRHRMSWKTENPDMDVEDE
jgi:integrase